MRIRAISLLCAVGFCATPSLCDTILVDGAAGYSIYLPANWTAGVYSDSHDVFYDATRAYRSQLSVVNYHIDGSVYDTPEDWVRANYIAYRMYLELDCGTGTSDCYPYGVILYADSAGVQYTSERESLWTCEMYIRFYGYDTSIFAWDEYVRYTAAGNRGYELYAMGDTVDMSTNIGLYGALLQATEVISAAQSALTSTAHRRTSSPMIDKLLSSDRSIIGAVRLLDALGRMQTLRWYLARGAVPGAGVYFARPEEPTTLR